jgi:hypothetical protein
LPAATLVLVWLAFSGAATHALAATRLTPSSAETEQPLPPIPIGKEDAFKDYFRIDQGCRLQIQGPGTLRFFVRAHVEPETIPPGTVSVTLDGLAGFPPQRWTVAVTPSRTSRYGDDRAGNPTGGKKITIAIPGGPHEISVSATSDIGGHVYAVFYYDGPPPPTVQPPDTRKKTTRKKTPKKEKWVLHGNFFLETIYDDNICRYSEATLEEFRRGENPQNFAITTYDDLIFHATLRGELSRRLLFRKKTRFRVRYKIWQYVRNDIKTNDEINLRLRQTFRRVDYLEATYTYAPNSYIKELSDRPPFTSRTVPREYLHFRITRNAFTLAYWSRVYRWLAIKGTGGRTLRFYNRPFLENDLWEWNARITTDLRWRRFTITLDYKYADVKARGYDSVGETLENSDNTSDGSYEKDSYRTRLAYRPKKSAYRAGSAGDGLPGAITGLFKSLGSQIDRALVGVRTSSIYVELGHNRQFYTSQKPLHIDPLHVGRMDELWQIRAVWNSKPVWRKLSLVAGIRHTVRTADAPAGLIGEDDPSEEKDYIGNRYWVTVKYPLN